MLFSRLALLVGALGGLIIAGSVTAPARDGRDAHLETVQFAPRPGSEPRVRGGVPGRFDYYAMVMSWSPTFCATEARPGDSQCRPRGRPYAFILHGLWPQYERGFPESCPTPDRPFVPQSTIDRIQDIMPSRNLVIHEYRKHGVCSGLGPEDYFARSRQLFEKVKIPQRFHNPLDNQMVDTAQVVQEFVAANPGMKADHLAIVCNGPGNRLREIRVCFTQDGHFRSCGGNENPRRLCNSNRVFVPPLRADRGDETPRRLPRSDDRGPMLPGPVMPGQRNL